MATVGGLIVLAQVVQAAECNTPQQFYQTVGEVASSIDPVDWLVSAIASLLLFIAGLIGNLTLTLIGLLVDVAQFNNFIGAPAVVRGWGIVRDVCNMFFIVILLMIAFGSVFRIEEYQYKKILGKLLIMAVLINFSKSIAGFFIDIAQVVMLTFVNGFKEAAAGNFVNGFHLQDIFQFANDENAKEKAGSPTTFLAAAVLALITIIITAIVAGVYLVVFLLRIIALWFLVIISPIAYALSAFPGDAKKYSSMWWDYFGRYATTGPILAFFLWLSLAVMQVSGNALEGINVSESQGTIPAAAITNIGRSDVLLSFVVNIILLMGGLWMTQQLGVAGGKLASSAMNKIQSAGAAIAKSPWSATKLIAKSANQSLVKASRGRVSLDPRDYIKAFTTAREERRKEAYQDFFGRKQQFFKQWGTPTGAIRLIFGARGRRKAKDKADEYGREIRAAKEKLAHGHSGTKYRAELHKQISVQRTELSALEAQHEAARDPVTKQQLGLKIKAKRSELAKNLNLTRKSDDELSGKYKEKLEADIKRNTLLKKKYEALAKGDTAQVIKGRKDELGQDIDRAVDEEKQLSYLRDVLEQQASGEYSDDEGALKVKLAAIENEAAKVLQDKADAEARGDYDEADKLGRRLELLQLQQAIIQGVQLPYLSKKSQFDTIDGQLKATQATKASLLKQRDQAQKDKREEDVVDLDAQLRDVTDDEERLKAERAKVKTEMDDLKGDPKAIDARYEDVTAQINQVQQQKLIHQQEMEKIEKATPADLDDIAAEIKKGWEAIEKDLDKRNATLVKERDMRDLTRPEQEQIRKSIRSMEAQIDKMKTAWYQTAEPAGYFVEQERRRNTAEELKKITSENPEELISEFKKAVASKHVARAKALVMKLTNDYNLNELMNAYGEKSNFEGLNNFREKILQGKDNLGLDEQEALQFQNDVSYAAENVGHWASARTVGYDVVREKYYPLDEEEHTKIALAEIMKMQPRNIVSSINRLGYGGERPLPDGTLRFEIDKLGQAIVIAAQNVLKKEIGHFQINAATNLSSPQSMAVLRQLVDQGKVEGDILRLIQSRVASSTERTPNELVNFLMRGIRR